MRDILSTKYFVDMDEVKPVRKHGYLVWLTYSLFPNARVRIENQNLDVSDYALICLGCPKWTFSCPPFNEYLSLITGVSGKTLVLFVTFGGFREKGFVAQLLREIRRKGAASVSPLVIKRRNVDDGSYAALTDTFAGNLIANKTNDA